MTSSFEHHLYQLVAQTPLEHRADARAAIDLVLATGVLSYAHLLHLLNTPLTDARLLTSVCWIVGQWGDAAAVPHLLVCLEHPQWGVRVEVIRALVDLRAQVTIPAIAERLAYDESTTVRMLAVFALGNFQTMTALKHLVACIEDSHQPLGVRVHALEALARYRNTPLALATVVNGLRHPAAEMRAWSAYALGEIGSPDHIRHLEPLTRDATKVDGGWSVGQQAQASIAHLLQRAQGE